LQPQSLGDMSVLFVLILLAKPMKSFVRVTWLVLMLRPGMWKFTCLGYVFLLFIHSSEIREKRDLVLGFGYWFEDLGFGLSMQK